jgi:hypothetical protein
VEVRGEKRLGGWSEAVRRGGSCGILGIEWRRRDGKRRRREEKRGEAFWWWQLMPEVGRRVCERRENRCEGCGVGCAALLGRVFPAVANRWGNFGC